MSFHIISTIARYEMRTLLRSWFFRIFVGLAIFGLGIFNIGLNLEQSGAPWIYRALAASIPYANLIILNLGQAIVAVFLASEFLKQDKKNDSVEVIYARSMSNGEYILGKTLGILAVFLVLNIIVLLLGIGFSFLSNVSSQNVFSYFMYPLLISLPTLVFILGLAFFMMVLVKNQAITFILLLGYIALTIFYLNKKVFHIFDYIAYQIPMMYSSISGFGNFTEILYHRLIYLLLGIGLIFLTVYRLQRLPQSPKQALVPLYFGLFFIVGGGFFVHKYLDLKYATQKFKTSALELNNLYSHYPRVTLSQCELKLEHKGDEIAVEALMEVENQSPVKLDTLILSLNPGLIIQNILYNQKEVRFTRKLQLVIIRLPSTLNKDEKAEINLHYSGNIDERICFLDLASEEKEDNFYMEVFTLRKRYAFLQKNYVCLTSESLWYPIPGMGYATNRPFYYEPDFTKFSLQVKTVAGLTAISQGRSDIKKDGTFHFTPEHPLPKLSLLIGNYKKKSIKVDSVEYNLYSIKGNDYYELNFKDIADTVPFLIRDVKQEYESETGFKYPYKRLTLAEIPIHFALDKHLYAYGSDAVQPEIIMYPEKGVVFDASDFRHRRYNIEREMKRNNEEALPDEIQTRMFKQFVKNNFMANNDQWYPFREITNSNTYSLFPEYFSFVSHLQSDKWPILPIALEAYFNDRKMEKGSTPAWYEDLSKEERINLELSGQSLQSILKNGIVPSDDERNSVVLRDIVLAKGKHLFNTLSARFGERELDTLLTELIAKTTFKKLNFESFNESFNSRFSSNLENIIQKWYNEKDLPGFLIGNISSYKVVDREATKYQVKLRISNPEKVDGFITLNVELTNPNRNNNNNWENQFNADFSRKIYIPALSSREIGYLFNTEPARMAVVTHISKNLPYNLIFNFTGFNEIRNVAGLDTIVPVPFDRDFATPDEVIVDNEDKGFSYQQAANQAYLKSLLKNKGQRYKYAALHSWNPAREWKAVLRSEFYGKYTHSAYYTRGGTGERKSVWKAVLPEKATYEVYFYMDKPTFGWRRSNKSPDFNISVYHDGGVEKINQSTEGVENGWFFLGSFLISDTAKVELTNKSNGDMVFADAVKWVKVK